MAVTLADIGACGVVTSVEEHDRPSLLSAVCLHLLFCPACSLGRRGQGRLLASHHHSIYIANQLVSTCVYLLTPRSFRKCPSQLAPNTINSCLVSGTDVGKADRANGPTFCRDPFSNMTSELPSRLEQPIRFVQNDQVLFGLQMCHLSIQVRNL